MTGIWPDKTDWVIGTDCLFRPIPIALIVLIVIMKKVAIVSIRAI